MHQWIVRVLARSKSKLDGKWHTDEVLNLRVSADTKAAARKAVLFYRPQPRFVLGKIWKVT